VVLAVQKRIPHPTCDPEAASPLLPLPVSCWPPSAHGGGRRDSGRPGDLRRSWAGSKQNELGEL